MPAKARQTAICVNAASVQSFCVKPAYPTIPGIDDTRLLCGNKRRINSGLGRVNFQQGVTMMVGDVNGTRSVSASDISAVKARSGQVATALNFKFDVNATGAISASDISAVKARSGLVLAP